MKTKIAASVDEYIDDFPAKTQISLKRIREIVWKVVPQVEEKISYGMPAFELQGKYLIYFAAHKKHIGLYPLPKANASLEKSFSKYKTSGRGTIQFQLNEPLPVMLIEKIIKLRAKENQASAKKLTTRKQKTT